PEVLKTVRMHRAFGVRNGVVNDLMLKFIVDESVGLQGIGVQVRAKFNMFAKLDFYRVALAVSQHLRAYRAAALQNAHDDGLIALLSRLLRSTLAIRVHVADLATDEGFVRFQ